MTDIQAGYRRFDIPLERALSISGSASVMLSSLLALERHEKEAQSWLADWEAVVEKAVGVDGFPPAAQNADIRKEALMDQLKALRRDIADLAADAATMLPSPEGPVAIIIPKDLPLFEGNGSMSQAWTSFSRWYVQGTATHLRSAAQNAQSLIRHLGETADPETENLVDALRKFVNGVQGQKNRGREA